MVKTFHYQNCVAETEQSGSVKAQRVVCSQLAKVSAGDSDRGLGEGGGVLHCNRSLCLIHKDLFSTFSLRRTPPKAMHIALVYLAFVMLVSCLLNVPAIGSCISGTDLLRQFHVLPR